MTLRKLRDLAVVGGTALALVALWWWQVGPYWGGFLIAGALALGAVELLARGQTGMTISQQFWAYSKDNKAGAVLLLASLAVAIGLIIWHLGVKL